MLFSCFERMFQVASTSRKGLLRKPLSSACLRLGSLFCAVPRWCVRLERAEKVAGDCCYLVNGSKECSFVGFRWLVEAAHLSHELQGGRTNLFLAHRRFEVEKRLDVSTHKPSLDGQSHLTFEFSDVANEMVNFCSLAYHSIQDSKTLLQSYPFRTSVPSSFRSTCNPIPDLFFSA